MKAITERSLIREVAKNWNKQYSDGRYGDDKLEKGRKLSALNPETATAADVAGIIGNRSWTSRSCHECGVEGVEVVELGQEPDYESSTAHICMSCLENAIACLKAAA